MLSGGFVATAFVLHLAGLALVRAVQPLRYSRSFALRQAVLHIARPGNQTRVILLAVGLGTFFILGVRTLQANLLEDFAVQVGEDAPDMFLIDIQAGSERYACRVRRRSKMAARRRQTSSRCSARASRLSADARSTSKRYEQVRGRGSLSREYTITYRPQINSNEELLAGHVVGREPVNRRGGGVDRREPAAALSHQHRRSDARSTCWGGRSRRA